MAFTFAQVGSFGRRGAGSVPAAAFSASGRHRSVPAAAGTRLPGSAAGAGPPAALRPGRRRPSRIRVLCSAVSGYLCPVTDHPRDTDGDDTDADAKPAYGTRTREAGGADG
ncbi:hypothetical protein GCM10014719_51820 [Planomonospora parontospora subsp. antibiotica]|nr:hypothetical protein GCM10014719_51820 [Planomonospora parontospora subsp. antibiotica]GII18579.1 hypothetical protein Ppa05_53050 [Planomonospora parontospora subsp. antibiotica]